MRREFYEERFISKKKKQALSDEAQVTLTKMEGFSSAPGLQTEKGGKMTDTLSYCYMKI